MADASDARELLDQLEAALADLKHQYDLFFSGKRRRSFRDAELPIQRVIGIND